MKAAVALPLSLALVMLGGCAPAVDATQALQPGREVVVEGIVSRVDTAPWTYDGDALVVLASAAHGTVTVHLPARWNLCKAPAPDVLSTLQPGERVVAEGTATGPADLAVCMQARHRLQRAP